MTGTPDTRHDEQRRAGLGIGGRKSGRTQVVRNVVLFLVGLAGLIDQAFFVRPVSPIAIAVFAAMIGYPGALSTLSVNVILPGGEKRQE